MEGFVWSLRTLDVFLVVVPVLFLHLLVTFSLERPDLLMLLGASCIRNIVNRHPSFQPTPPGPRPTGLVIIPSLLRDKDDFQAIVTTIESCATNGFPSRLTIVASVDGRTEYPTLYADLVAWTSRQRYGSEVQVHVTGTEKRGGKMMAVEAGVTYIKELVASGALEAFPDIYFSIDGDGTLGPHALERLATRLATKHWLTGNAHRIVSGKLAIRPDLIWRGWRAFFTIEGQLYQQVAREFVVSNLMRFNRKLTPQIGVPGALYCCWSDLLIMAPYYMGFMRTIRLSHWLKWWAGHAPPKFSESKAPPSSEALTGASDDTCMAFLASMATWRDGKLSLDAPRSPLHALARLFVSFWIERSHAYEPEARIYTFTPSTVKGLWVQRVRWNSSRFECTGRFLRGFMFHWEIAFPTTLHLSLVVHQVVRVLVYYCVLPLMCLGRGHFVLGFVYGYAFHVFEDIIYTSIAFAMERDYRRCWRSAFCLPLTPLYTIVLSNLACAYGVTKDLLLFGNPTKFAPEWTLIKGDTARVALLFRARRFLALTVRAALYNDVPFGAFWFGWRATAWTPNGFEGWTTGKKQRAILPLPGVAFLRRSGRARTAPESIAVATSPLATLPSRPHLSLVPCAAADAPTRTVMRASTRPLVLEDRAAPASTKRAA